jgi:FK506-binding protein 6
MDSIDRVVGEEDLQGIPVTREDVLDYSQMDYEYNEEDIERNKIRISNGISTRDLISDGIIFDPQIPEAEELEQSGQTNFYAQYGEELEKLLEQRNLEVPVSSDLEADLSEFDQIRRLMNDISPDDGEEGLVLKRVLSPGVQTGGTVPRGATVTLHYSLALEGQDEPFDSTVLRGRSERYKLDQGQLILGLEVGIRSMHRNERAQFLIDWTYAYGQHGCPPRVPGCAVVLATVELLEFVEEGQAEALLGLEVEERNKSNTYEQIEAVVRLEHQNGNLDVKKEEWKLALKHYSRGVQLLEEVSLASQEQEDRQQRLLLKLQLNNAHCCLKLKWPKKACVACRGVLEIDDRHSSAEQITRALYRFGKAKRMLEDYDMAKELLLKAQQRAPQDPHISKVEIDRVFFYFVSTWGNEKLRYLHIIAGPKIVPSQ